MGNNPSKHKSKKDDSQFQSYPSFSRTDTQGSSRSIRSIRSKISSISQNSDPAMGFKSAQQETFSPTNQSFPTNIPSHSSGNSLSNGSNLSVNNKGVPGNSFLASPSMGSHMNNHMGTSLGAMPISPNGFNIPASMQQIQPKEPILIRRDGEGNITPRTFGTLNDNEDTDGGVDYFGFLPDNYDAEDNNGDIRSKANSKNNDSYNVERDDDDNDNNNGEDNDIFNNDEFDDDNNIITRSTNHDLTDNLGNLSLKEPSIIVTDDSNGHTPITHQRKDSFPINSPPIAQSHSRTPSGSSFHTPISPNFPRVFGSGSLPSPIDTTHKGDLNEISNNNTVISPNNYESSTPLSSSFNQSTGFGGSLGVNGADMPTLTNVISSETTTKKGKTPVVLTPQSLEEMIQRLLDAGYSGKTTKNVCLKNSEIASICRTAREILLSQPMLLELSPPVKVVGDVHGQFGDVIRMFDLCGFPPASNYLFLGDYVDRGKQSLETILLLLCYKIKYPENFFLLRGNHECANVTRVYGFYDECKRRCNIKTWKIFIDTFNTLPIAAIVAQKIFCVHGGLSPTLGNMNEIRSIQRPTDVPDYGLLNDLLWSDPADTNNEWEDNERGVSYCFNKVSINKFLAKFGFDLVCRAHMVVEDGYEFFNDRSLVTVFSAPNYCGEFDNWGAVMSVSEELLCSFELLKPLDSVALRQVMKRGKYERRASMKSLQREREQALLGLNTNADTSSNSLVVNSMNTGTGPA